MKSHKIILVKYKIYIRRFILGVRNEAYQRGLGFGGHQPQGGNPQGGNPRGGHPRGGHPPICDQQEEGGGSGGLFVLWLSAGDMSKMKGRISINL